MKEKCCMGCKGGLMTDAMDFLVHQQSGGIDTEDSYKYTGKDGQCEFGDSSKSVGATISGYKTIKQGDEAALLTAVAAVGPISVGVDASTHWQFYHKGVMKPKGLLLSCSANPRKMDHGVAIVGYGTAPDGEDYWIVRNSWGTAWGEEGYVRLQRGVNACGVANAAVYPTGVSQSE